MTLRQLELLIAVAETASFSRGAELMTLTQSTVSQHIAALERELNTRLLDRTSKGIYLTAGGEVFLQHARRVLAELDVLKQAMAGFHGLENAHLTIGASNIPANYLVPRLLPLLNQQYPGITVNMKIGDSREMLSDLHNGKIELAIVGARFDEENFSYQPILKDRLVLIVGPDHPLRDKQKISIKELVRQPLILREDGSGTYQTIRNAFTGAGIDTSSLHVVARLGSNEAVRQAVASGFGCAFVSDLSVHSNLQHGELFKVAVRDLVIERNIWLVRLLERTPSPASLAVSELLLQTTGALESSQVAVN